MNFSFSSSNTNSPLGNFFVMICTLSIFLSFMNERRITMKTHILVYPYKGFLYFVSQPECWDSFFKHLKPLLLVTLLVYLMVLPIVFLISFFTGGIFLAMVPSIIQSCNFIINFINKRLILPKTLKRLFDHIINTHMELKYNKLPKGVLNPYLPGYYGETWAGKSYRNGTQMLRPGLWVLRLIICFLVNMIPFVGPFLVIFIRAPTSGFNKHKRYFHLKGYTNAQIYFVWIHQRHVYFMFGMISLLLESIPFVGYLFIFTNMAGAAFWAVDIEDNLYKQLTTSLKTKEKMIKVEEQAKEKQN